MDRQGQIRFRGGPCRQFLVQRRGPDTHEHMVPPAHPTQAQTGVLLQHHDHDAAPGAEHVTIKSIMVVTERPVK